MKKFNYIMLSLLVFVFILIYAVSVDKKSNGFICDNIINNDIIIIVGDSRMELLEKRRNNINIPYYVEFDARSGADINWFKEVGIPKLYNMLDDKNNTYKVVFNLGVNDLDENIDIKKRVYEYYKIYKNIMLNNKTVKFYYLTVNPIDDDIINTIWKSNIRTNKKIEKFNNYMKYYIKNTNMLYCNSYKEIKFNLPDGLHYDYNTDILILDYVLNKCVIKGDI